MRRAVPLFVVLLAGCQSAAQRCADIRDAKMRAELLPLANEQRARNRARMRAQYPDDSSRWGPAPDTVATPPPRPSDLAWYDEHCWDGKPR